MKLASRSLHVPEPQEIAAWSQRQWSRLRAYLRQPERQLFWAILLVAAGLRWSYLDLVPFSAPQARELQVALNLAERWTLPLAGTATAEGLVRPPFMSYFLSLPLLLGRDPRLAAAAIGLLHLVAIAGCYGLARRLFGVPTAAMAAALWAVNPWGLLFARQLTPESLLPPLAMLLLWSTVTALGPGHPWSWTWAVVAWGLMVLTSYAALPLLLVLLVVVLLYRARVSWLHLLLGFLVVTLLALPFLYYENLHHFADLGLLLVNLLRGWRLSGQEVQLLAWAGWIHSGRNLAALGGSAAAAFAPARSWFARLDLWALWLFWAAAGYVVWEALRAWSRWREGRDSAPYAVLALWLWLPILLVTTPFSRLEPQYLIILYPAGFLAMALAAQRLFELALRGVRRWWTPFLGAALALVFLGLLAWQVYNWLYLQDFIEAKDVRPTYGVPYRYWRRTVNLARREAQAVAADCVWVVAHGTDNTADEEPLVLDYLLGPRLKAVFLGQDGAECLPLPAERPGVYLLLRQVEPVEALLRQVGAQGRGLVPFPDGRTTARVQVAAPQSVEKLLALVPSRGWWALDVGWQLVGYDWPADVRAGHVARLVTYWALLDLPGEELAHRHHLVVQVADAEGKLVGQGEGLGLPERYWQPGMVLAHWLDVPLRSNLPDGAYSVLVRMIRLDDGYVHRLLDAQGRELGQTISLGPLRMGAR
jgi:4-amino-4-deoxy-L-arabinose transferase-like glycosyltransferase